MKSRLALLSLAALASSPALAAERGFYAGLDLGQASYDLDRRDIDSQIVDAFDSLGLAVLSSSSSTSEDGFMYGITLGYQILPYLAVEASYVDLDDAEYRGSATMTDGVATADFRTQVTTESSGPALSVLGILPLPRNWEVYARAGVYFSSTDVTARLSSGDVVFAASDSSNSEEFLWGAGVGYSRDQWTVRLDYQQYTDVGDEDVLGEVNVDRIAFSALYRFKGF
jgi:opacity protein-like surface antigen